MTPRRQILTEIQQIAQRHNVPMSALMGRRRFRQFVDARREAYDLVYERLGRNWTRAATFFDRDPTTLFYVVKGRKK